MLHTPPPLPPPPMKFTFLITIGPSTIHSVHELLRAYVLRSPMINRDWLAEDDQSILIETSSCNLQFISGLITTQLRDFHMVSPQVAFLTYLPHRAKLHFTLNGPTVKVQGSRFKVQGSRLKVQGSRFISFQSIRIYE